MNKVKGFQDTIDWYNSNAKQYADASSDFPTVDNMNKFVTYLPTSGRVLDAGCGAGRDTKLLMQRGFDVTGLDYSSGLIEEAKKRHPDGKFLVGDMRALEFRENDFDGIWSQASLLHLETVKDVEKSLSEFYRVLKEKGVLYILVKAQTGKDKTAVVSDTLSGHDRFFQYFTRKEIEDLVKQAGFTIEYVKQYNEIKYNPQGRPEVEWIMLLGRKIK